MQKYHHIIFSITLSNQVLLW